MPRKRAALVCEYCHSHKVRCDVQFADRPCSKCTAVGEACHIRLRKQYPARRRMRRPLTEAWGSGKRRETITSPFLVDPTSSHVKIVAAAFPEPSARKTSIFAGNGGYGNILDVVGGGTPNRFFEVYATAEKPLDADDLNYLNAKGCFTLPEQSEELLEAYFRFVHPTFPIIDVSALSKKVAACGLQGINLLLLWSMFSVSASYVPSMSRKLCKELFVSRAKLLFEISQEHDKLVLVQSALLLSFWFADTEDIKQSWYWTSIAFSIAQSLGLHEKETRYEQADAQQQSQRLTWQCCLVRDVWLAYGMGRPLRIVIQDPGICFGRPEPQFADLTFQGRSLYSSDEALAFESMWQSFITTSAMLRSVITSKKVALLTAEFSQGRVGTPEIRGSTLITNVSRHLELHQLTVAIALAHARGEGKELESAVDGSIAVLQAMLDDRTVEFASPVTIPLVIPTMVRCLDTTRSKHPDEHSEKMTLSRAKLNVISNFLAALEDNYPSASIVRQVLSTARHEIENN